MKKLLVMASVFTLILLVAGGANAQNKMALNIGADVLFPLGDFGNASNIGFGGTAQFEYYVNPMLAVTGKFGYITWSAKTGDVPAGVTASGSFKGLPLLFGAKYYFMPEGKARVYGQFELGLFFASASGTVEYAGYKQDYSASETDFSIAPAIGVEIPAGHKGAIDISARYFGIFKDGSANNIGARVGYKFMLN
jgi:outer membrane protein W